MVSRWFTSRRACGRLASSLLASGVALVAAGNSRAQAPAAPTKAPGIVLFQPDEEVKPDKPAPLKEVRPDAAPAPAPVADSCVDGSGFDWSKVPPVIKLQRAGNFYFPASGCGYYSLCDLIQGKERDKTPPLPWPPITFNAALLADNDFRYLDKPDNQQFDFFDPIKRIHLGDNFLFSFGGEERIRTMHEIDSRLTKVNNDYTLLRSRIYGDAWYQDKLRVYVEFNDARSYDQNLPPAAIDINRTDLQNAFVDVKVGEVNDSPIYVRAGRQELVLGSQRLISALDWANTRRTFEGIRSFYRSETLDADVFWVRPEIVNPSHFDAADYHRQFAGAWLTYKPKQGQAIDLYYLYLDENRPVPAIPGLKKIPGERGGENNNTIGARYSGDSNNFLWDVEGAYQFGDAVGDSLNAGMLTGGAGYYFKDLPTTPVVWLYYDYATGDDHGRIGGTFNQLFPFGHYYFGFLDLVGRQNINDLNFHLYSYPTQWVWFGFQYHQFALDSRFDALYSAGGAVERKSAKGTAGTDVGEEIDLITNFHLSMHSDICVGWSKLFAGDFIKQTGPNVSPELFYVQYSFRW
jgi:hypothetical protein